jgi:hypothetical protein
MNNPEPLQLPNVEKFREIALWPVQLIPGHSGGSQLQNHWECLNATSANSVWKEMADEFRDEPAKFEERHYKEFVTFLPFVRRFLYGEGGDRNGNRNLVSPRIRVFRRKDVAQARITLPGDVLPETFEVEHVDLYFFYDIDIAILVTEIVGEKLSLRQALDTLYRFGRAYPTHWEPSGRGGHCPLRLEWISHSGAVLAVSDYEKKARYLKFVSENRAPCVASHWEFLMEPLVLDHSQRNGDVRYREIEYQRMPLMSYVALDENTRLTRGDLVRLGLVTPPGDARKLPFSERFLEDFERRYCYDRYWEEAKEHDFTDARLISNGHDFTVIGQASEAYFTDAENGVLGQFRHQYFLFFLITHFHKAALLMLSNQLAEELSQLDIRQPDSVREFRRDIKQVTEIFLRFTHRYWFHEVSDQAQARDLFTMMGTHLGTDELYKRTRLRILDMNDYLEKDQLRRQTDAVVRLTVVTTLGLVGTVTTGFLGMNLIAAADNTLTVKLIYFTLILIPATALTVYMVVKSKRLAEFLEALSNERLTSREKLDALSAIWKKERRRSARSP